MSASLPPPSPTHTHTLISQRNWGAAPRSSQRELSFTWLCCQLDNTHTSSPYTPPPKTPLPYIPPPTHPIPSPHPTPLNTTLAAVPSLRRWLTLMGTAHQGMMMMIKRERRVAVTMTSPASSPTQPPQGEEAGTTRQATQTGKWVLCGTGWARAVLCLGTPHACSPKRLFEVSMPHLSTGGKFSTAAAFDCLVTITETALWWGAPLCVVTSFVYCKRTSHAVPCCAVLCCVMLCCAPTGPPLAWPCITARCC